MPVLEHPVVSEKGDEDTPDNVLFGEDGCLELFGFFGGVHLAVLSAFICQSNPLASLSALISIFFKTFVFWPWLNPVILQDGMMPLVVHSEIRSLMPILLPCSPNEYCHSNITNSTFNKIREEFRRGHHHTLDLLRLDFDWRDLFEPFNYSKRYPQFVKICLAASDQNELGDWVGWVKSRFCSLLVKGSISFLLKFFNFQVREVKVLVSHNVASIAIRDICKVTWLLRYIMKIEAAVPNKV